MGLCKCPKRKVTNLFCFEHRVNVCEHCLVESHSKCVVQSYLSWLADSDYDPNCSFCSTPLVENDTVRLKCLHLFHWPCFNAWARSLPANTAPAGYRCPLCNEGVFPPANQTSPTIDVLRNILKESSWARAGLGLPLLPGFEGDSIVKAAYPPNPAVSNSEPIIHVPENATASFRDIISPTVVEFDDVYTQRARKPLETGNITNVIRGEKGPLISPSNARDEDLPENKYKRRSAKEWLGRWIRSRYGNQGRSIFDVHSRCKRAVFAVFLFLIITITVFTILSRIVGVPADDDPAFDPLANPNIRVAPLHDDMQ